MLDKLNTLIDVHFRSKTSVKYKISYATIMDFLNNTGIFGFMSYKIEGVSFYENSIEIEVCINSVSKAAYTFSFDDNEIKKNFIEDIRKLI